jgi:hypothetical protein
MPHHPDIFRLLVADRNEFLTLDISTNSGASWQIEVRRLDGNVDAKNMRLVGVPVGAEPLGLVRPWAADASAADMQGRNDGTAVSLATLAPLHCSTAPSTDRHYCSDHPLVITSRSYSFFSRS